MTTIAVAFSIGALFISLVGLMFCIALSVQLLTRWED